MTGARLMDERYLLLGGSLLLTVLCMTAVVLLGLSMLSDGITLDTLMLFMVAKVIGFVFVIVTLYLAYNMGLLPAFLSKKDGKK